jgi:hypothetical protein
MSLVAKYNWVLADAAAAQFDGLPQRNTYTIVWLVTRQQQLHSSAELNFFFHAQKGEKSVSECFLNFDLDCNKRVQEVSDITSESLEKILPAKLFLTGSSSRMTTKEGRNIVGGGSNKNTNRESVTWVATKQQQQLASAELNFFSQ